MFLSCDVAYFLWLPPSVPACTSPCITDTELSDFFPDGLRYTHPSLLSASQILSASFYLLCLLFDFLGPCGFMHFKFLFHSFKKTGRFTHLTKALLKIRNKETSLENSPSRQNQLITTLWLNLACFAEQLVWAFHVFIYWKILNKTVLPKIWYQATPDQFPAIKNNSNIITNTIKKCKQSLLSHYTSCFIKEYTEPHSMLIWVLLIINCLLNAIYNKLLMITTSVIHWFTLPMSETSAILYPIFKTFSGKT